MTEKKANIQIIDDSDTDSAIMAHALKKNVMGNTVVTLNNAASAIDLLNKKEEFRDSEKPDLIILDLNLRIVWRPDTRLSGSI